MAVEGLPCMHGKEGVFAMEGLPCMHDEGGFAMHT